MKKKWKSEKSLTNLPKEWPAFLRKQNYEEWVMNRLGAPVLRQAELSAVPLTLHCFTSLRNLRRYNL
jgi:hypothetical protein